MAKAMGRLCAVRRLIEEAEDEKTIDRVTGDERLQTYAAPFETILHSLAT